jgi:hypothetical protein
MLLKTFCEQFLKNTSDNNFSSYGTNIYIHSVMFNRGKAIVECFDNGVEQSTRVQDGKIIIETKQKRPNDKGFEFSKYMDSIIVTSGKEIVITAPLHEITDLKISGHLNRKAIDVNDKLTSY